VGCQIPCIHTPASGACAGKDLATGTAFRLRCGRLPIILYLVSHWFATVCCQFRRSMYTRCRSVSSNSSRKRTRWGALKLPSPASRDNGEGKGGTTGRKERGWRKGENRGWDGGTGNGVGRRQAGGREEKEWRRQGREGEDVRSVTF